MKKNWSFIVGSEGQSIIEALVALSSILISLAAISVAIITSVNNTQFIKDQSIASKYAQQGMEYIKYIRNNDPATFFSYNGIKCMNQDDSFLNTSCSSANIAGAYKREAEFSQNDSQCVAATKVTVTVYWTSTKCQSGSFCHSSSLISCFSTIPVSLKSL